MKIKLKAFYGPSDTMGGLGLFTLSNIIFEYFKLSSTLTFVPEYIVSFIFYFFGPLIMIFYFEIQNFVYYFSKLKFISNRRHSPSARACLPTTRIAKNYTRPKSTTSPPWQIIYFNLNSRKNGNIHHSVRILMNRKTFTREDLKIANVLLYSI